MIAATAPIAVATTNDVSQPVIPDNPATAPAAAARRTSPNPNVDDMRHTHQNHA